MMYKLRDYQQKASDTAVAFFNDKKAKYNAIMVMPTGCGKSLLTDCKDIRLSFSRQRKSWNRTTRNYAPMG